MQKIKAMSLAVTMASALQRLEYTVDSLFHFLREPHYRIDRNGALIFTEHDASQSKELPILSWIFFMTFFPIWLFSLASVPLFIYSVMRESWYFPVFYLTLAIYTYSPWIKKRNVVFRLLLFLNVPKYYKKSSVRVLSPDKFPEFKLMKEALASTETASLEAGWHIVSLRKAFRQLKPPCRLWLYHPHGLLSTGWGLQAFNPYIVNNEMCISTALYLTPPVIFYTSHCGRPSPVTANTVKAHLRDGRSMTIILGGFDEAAIHPNSGDRIYLSRRKGIFKYALQYGCEIVPVFIFGETQSYKNIQGHWKLRLWLTQRGIPAMVPWGRSPFGYLPKNDMLHVVMGDPIQVPVHHDAVKHQDVQDLHHLYTQTVDALYETWKKEFYGPAYDKKLEIW